MAAAVLDASSINVALPAIAGALRLAPSRAIWLVTAYQAALVAGLLPLAAIGERYGYRQTFMLGLCLFGGCAFACSVAPTFAWLVGLRALQGLGAAAIMALGVALLRQTVAPEELGRAIGWNAMTVALLSAAGPAIGASLLSLGGWHFVFAGALPLAIGAICASLALPPADSASRALDGRGLLVYVAIVPAFAVAAGLAPVWPGMSVTLGMAGLLGAVWLVQRDRHRVSPFLPLDLLRSRAFTTSVVASISCFIGQSLALLFLPFALHTNLGTSPFETGLLMTPWPLAVLVTTPVTTRLLRRVSSASLCAAGGLCLACGLGTLAFIPSYSDVAPYLIGVSMCGMGFGLFQTPNNRNMFLSAPVERAASAGGLQGTARLTGQAVGGLITTFLLGSLPIEVAIRSGFVTAAFATLLAGGISLSRQRHA